MDLIYMDKQTKNILALQWIQYIWINRLHSKKRTYKIFKHIKAAKMLLKSSRTAMDVKCLNMPYNDIMLTREMNDLPLIAAE